MYELLIKTTCNICGSEGVLANGKIFTPAGKDCPLLNRSSGYSNTSPRAAAPIY
jgi:hypothetical protein